MTRTVLVTSCKGGVGKSTVAANLTMALSTLGKKCILIDMDLGNRSLDLMLGCEDRVVYDISDVCSGRVEIDRALIEAVAFGTKVIVDLFENGGIKISECYAGGGIAVKNKLLMQIFADVTGKEIKVTDCVQAGAVGSAILAASAAEVCDTMESTVKRNIGNTKCQATFTILVNNAASLGKLEIKPPISNQPNSIEKILITILPRKKVGNEIPIIVKTVTV